MIINYHAKQQWIQRLEYLATSSTGWSRGKSMGDTRKWLWQYKLTYSRKVSTVLSWSRHSMSACRKGIMAATSLLESSSCRSRRLSACCCISGGIFVSMHGVETGGDKNEQRCTKEKIVNCVNLKRYLRQIIAKVLTLIIEFFNRWLYGSNKLWLLQMNLCSKNKYRQTSQVSN